MQLQQTLRHPLPHDSQERMVYAMNVLCVIPARFASTRLPGKPLKDIAGKPMVCRVYDRASQARMVSDTIVATDDERILEAIDAYLQK